MFTDRLDVKLISRVRENPVLYDTSHPKYMDFNTREVTWQKIGDELKRPAGDCKVRWINIRDVNRRILKKNLTHPRSPQRVYKYESELSFMKPYYKDVAITESEDRSQWEDGADEACDAPVDSDDSEKSVKKSTKASKKSKKRKKWDYDEEEEEPLSTLSEQPSVSDFDPSDPVDAFLLSIGATLKTFSPYHLNLAKSKIFSVVQEHDLQQIVQKTSDVKSDTDALYLG